MEGEQAIGYGLGAVISSCVYMKSIFLKRFPAEYRRMLFYRWIGFFIIDHAVKFVLVFLFFKAGVCLSRYLPGFPSYSNYLHFSW